MIIAPSGLISNMESYTRNPTSKLFISWDTILLSGEWFKLDQTELDSGGILTQYEYEEGDTILEGLSDIDSRIYTDETDYLLSLEGYSKLQGDSYQYSIADMDVLLDNTNSRYIPRENKNKLNNSGFEFNKDSWNESLGTNASSFIDEYNPHYGIRDLQINNPDQNDALIFSNIIDVYTTDGYNKIPILSAEDWNLSFYATGSGIMSLNLMAYDLSASGSNDITTGYLSGSAYQISLEDDASGVWNRFDTSLSVPSGTYYLRALLSISGCWARFDDGQVEKSLNVTDIENNFIGDLILPKRAIRSEIGFNNYNVPKFTGLTTKFIPNIAEDTIQIYAYDMADRLKDIIIVDKYYENKRTDELIVELASLANIEIESISLETGTNTVEFAYFQEGSVWTYMNQVAESEGGRIFFDETGKLIFWNRNHYRNNTDIKYTFDFSNNIIDLSYEISKKKVKNYIKVQASPKKKLVNTKIYDDTTNSSIGSGETEEFFCQYNYKEETSIAALNVVVPTIGTDIIANTAENGSGSNISSDISISSYYIFRDSMRLNLHNANASTAYLTTFQIYGDPIVTARYIKEIKEDKNSEAIYDTQKLNIENNLITTDSFASDLATQKLAELKDSRDFIKIDAVGVPYLQLGDMVKVQRSFDGTYEKFIIIENSWSFQDDFTQTLTLEKKVIV